MSRISSHNLARHIAQAGGASPRDWPWHAPEWALGYLRFFAIAACTFALLWVCTILLTLGN